MITIIRYYNKTLLHYIKTLTYNNYPPFLESDLDE